MHKNLFINEYPARDYSFHYNFFLWKKYIRINFLKKHILLDLIYSINTILDTNIFYFVCISWLGHY